MPKGPLTDFQVLTPSGFVTHPYTIQLLAAGYGDITKAYIEIPPTDVAIELTLVAPLGLQDYTYIMVGTLDATTSPPTAPRFTFRDLVSPNSRFAALYAMVHQEPVPPTVADGPFTVVARLRQVLCKKTPLYLEARWTPTRGEVIDMRGFEKDTRKKSVEAIIRGLQVLTTLGTSGGRPPDMEEAVFLQNYGDAYQKILVSGRRPTKTEVAAELVIHRKTLTRTLARYSLPWPPRLPR